MGLLKQQPTRVDKKAFSAYIKLVVIKILLLFSFLGKPGGFFFVERASDQKPPVELVVCTSPRRAFTGGHLKTH